MKRKATWSPVRPTQQSDNTSSALSAPSTAAANSALASTNAVQQNQRYLSKTGSAGSVLGNASPRVSGMFRGAAGGAKPDASQSHAIAHAYASANAGVVHSHERVDRQHSVASVKTSHASGTSVSSKAARKGSYAEQTQRERAAAREKDKVHA